MNAARPGMPGATRICPHCKASILESATVCPACRHHLRFDTDVAQKARRRESPFHVEGKIIHPVNDPVLEYSMVLAIRNERGEEIIRQVVGVGALYPSEERSFSLTVEVAEATGAKAMKSRR